MADQLRIGNSDLRLLVADITDIEIEAFVYYAQHDLTLGSGYGTSISIRGGPSVQKELREHGSLKTTEAVISGAGEMKAQYIVHAVGPRFQEENTEEKLKQTVLNALRAAEDRGISSIAFPPMGAGFYGVPLDISARVTLGTINEYLAGQTNIRRVVICLLDDREYKPFQMQLNALGSTRAGKNERITSLQ
jgi:O-acetyl-ADP-ribose deacetylase (regulator of RNase III)